MKKTISIFILTLWCQFILGQKDTITKFDNKYYRVYTSLADAQKVNPDSVFGLYLCCEGLKEFPQEVLKYPNLEFLYFYSNTWDDPIVYKHLSKTQKKKYHHIKKQQAKGFEKTGYLLGPEMPYFSPTNKIDKIPEEITKLKKLKVLALPKAKNWDDAYLAEIFRLEKLLPNTLVDPPSIAIASEIKFQKEHEARLKSSD